MTRWLKLRWLWPALIVAGAFVGPASTPIGLADIWWSLLSGGWMVERHALLTTDPFTSAPPVSGPIYNLQWLAQLVYYAMYRFGGLELVITGTALAVAATYALALAAAVAVTGRVRLACVVVVVAYLLGFSNLSPRPQSLAYPIFGVFLLAMTRAEWRRDSRMLWLLPPLTALWVNLHGSFFMGFLLLGCGLVSRVVSDRSLATARPYLLTLLGCGLAALMTPYGPGSLLYVASMSSNPIIRDFVTEWAPTSISLSEGGFFFASVAAVALLALRSPTRLTLFEILLLAGFGWLALSSVRAVVWWGLVLVPIATRLLAPLVPRPAQSAREQPALNLLVLASIVTLVVASLPWVKSAIPIIPADKQGLVAAESPIGAGEYLRTHAPPPGRMLNHLAWAGYLEWVAWPEHQPFLDGRIEIHAPQVWLDYLTMTFPGAGWRNLLDQYDIGYAVLDRGGEADLITSLRADASWRSVYEDDQAVVLVRA